MNSFHYSYWHLRNKKKQKDSRPLEVFAFGFKNSGFFAEIFVFIHIIVTTNISLSNEIINFCLFISHPNPHKYCFCFQWVFFNSNLLQKICEPKTSKLAHIWHIYRDTLQAIENQLTPPTLYMINLTPYTLHDNIFFLTNPQNLSVIVIQIKKAEMYLAPSFQRKITKKEKKKEHTNSKLTK